MQIIRFSSHQNSTTGVRGARAWVDAFTGLGYPNGLAVLLSWLVNLQLTHTYTGVGQVWLWLCTTVCEQFHYEFLARLIGGYVRSFSRRCFIVHFQLSASFVITFIMTMNG